MDEIGKLSDHRFAALSSEPGGNELISFHYVIANDGLETGSHKQFTAETG